VLEQLLRYFPQNTYPLTLVYDPDRLLENESVVSALEERGFKLLFEPNPVHLHFQIEGLKPFSIEHPIIIRSEKTLDELPYALWDQGHRVHLSLNVFFPQLSYPVIQQLTPTQLWSLGKVPQPNKRLGYEGTIKFVLIEIFSLDVSKLEHTDYFLLWLSEYHRKVEPMANLFVEFLNKQLTSISIYTNWPLADIITDKDRYLGVLQSLWDEYIDSKTGKQIGEPKIQYHVNFEESDLLQTQLVRLVQAGHIQPVRIAENEEIPYWIKPGVIAEAENMDLRRFVQLQETFNDYTPSGFVNFHWEEWQQLAFDWAEFTVLRHKPGLNLENAQRTFFKQKQDEINTAFIAWLYDKYSFWAGRQLPSPHHLYHVPHYLAFERSRQTIDRVALLVLDGMALADWHVIQNTWRTRHKDWQFDVKLLLAQIPTITAISRQALVSGLRPIEFADSITDNRYESKMWSSFWKMQQVAGSEIVYDRLPKNIGNKIPTWIDKPRLQVICMIKNNIDDMIHSAIHGMKGFLSDLDLWLDGDSINLESILDELLNQGFTLFLTSDHGHVEATGFGKIMDEGLTVETRAKRARVYNNFDFASQNKEKLIPSFLWHDDNVLPEDTWVLMPEKYHAYVSEDELVVAHGGASLEEVIVPFVRITSKHG
jgi:hypothetical protein